MSGISIADKNRYIANSPFKLSRAALEEFIDCPCCFHVKRHKGTKHPDTYPLSLNNKIDASLKDLFDKYRAQGKNHPLIEEQLKDLEMHAIPFQHRSMQDWRNQHRGLHYKLPGTQVTLIGIVDDIWYDPTKNELIIVDYKATSKKADVTIDAEWQGAYKRQVSIYQYILQGMIKTNPNDFPRGCKVSDTAFFVYLNGTTDDLDLLVDGMQFRTILLPFDRSKHRAYSNINWVEKTAKKAIECLNSNELPPANKKCDFCQYYLARAALDNLATATVTQKRYNVRMDDTKPSGVALYTASQESEDGAGADTTTKRRTTEKPSSSSSREYADTTIERRVTQKSSSSSSREYNVEALVARFSAPSSEAVSETRSTQFSSSMDYDVPAGSSALRFASNRTYNSLEAYLPSLSSATKRQQTSEISQDKRPRTSNASTKTESKDSPAASARGYLKIPKFDN